MYRAFLILCTAIAGSLFAFGTVTTAQSLSELSAAKDALSPLNGTSSIPEPSYKTYGRTQTRDENYGAGIIPPRYRPGDGVEVGYETDFDLRNSRRGLSDEAPSSSLSNSELTDINR